MSIDPPLCTGGNGPQRNARAAAYCQNLPGGWRIAVCLRANRRLMTSSLTHDLLRTDILIQAGMALCLSGGWQACMRCAKNPAGGSGVSAYWPLGLWAPAALREGDSAAAIPGNVSGRYWFHIRCLGRPNWRKAEIYWLQPDKEPNAGIMLSSHKSCADTMHGNQCG